MDTEKPTVLSDEHVNSEPSSECSQPDNLSPFLSLPSSPAPPSQTKTSHSHGKFPGQSTRRFGWIVKTNDGSFCGTCLQCNTKARSSQSSVSWITAPVPVSASRKLYEKVEKHDISAAHLAAMAASQIASPSVATKLIVASNAAAIQDSNMMKLCFGAVSEIPHTTQ